MSMKVIAMGNVLMKDDAIGIEIAKQIEKKLLEKNIEVIYGETDIQYSISLIKEDDYLMILDAASHGKNPGEITVIPLTDFSCNKKRYSQHNYSFLDLLKIYYPSIKGEIYAIEVKNAEFGFGLSLELQGQLKIISEQVLSKIEKSIKR